MPYSDQERELILRKAIGMAKEDFTSFLYYLHPQVAGQTYVISKVHEELSKYVSDTLSGRGAKNTAVSMPPQHGKSQLISVRAVAWALGAYPGICVAMTGFSFRLLQDFVHDVMGILASDRYRAVFGDLETVYGRNRQDQKFLSNGSSIVVKSTGTKLTGRRVDLLIIDDPHSGRESAESASSRKKVEQWFFADCLSRLAPDAKMFCIQTRWHPEDLIGTVTSDEYVQQQIDEGQEDNIFNVVNYPAIAISDDDPLGRKEGEPLFPEQRGLDFLLGVRASQPLYEWNSQYQGVPQTSGSGQIEVSKIKIIEKEELPEDLVYHRGWDLAITEKKTSDFTAGMLLGYHKESGEIYLVDLFHHKLNWAKLKSRILAKSMADLDLWGVTKIGMEAVSGFDVAYTEIKNDLLGKVKVERRNPKGRDKLVRAQPWINLVEAGKVYMVRDSWNRVAINEMETFPDGKHDDIVDSISIAYETGVASKKILLA